MEAMQPQRCTSCKGGEIACKSMRYSANLMTAASVLVITGSIGSALGSVIVNAIFKPNAASCFAKASPFVSSILMISYLAPIIITGLTYILSSFICGKNKIAHCIKNAILLSLGSIAFIATFFISYNLLKVSFLTALVAQFVMTFVGGIPVGLAIVAFLAIPIIFITSIYCCCSCKRPLLESNPIDQENLSDHSIPEVEHPEKREETLAHQSQGGYSLNISDLYEQD